MNFYAEFAPELSVAIPKPVYTALADDEVDFVLLMEDLAPGAAGGTARGRLGRRRRPRARAGGRAPRDWQGLGFGNGLVDVAYFMSTSLPVDVRRASERELVRHYQRSLRANGVDDYGEERRWDDYRLHAIHGLQVGIYGLGAVRRSERGDRMWKNWIERCTAQVRDLGSYAELARRK